VIEQPLVALLYLLSAVIFILGLKGLTRVRTARRGNLMAAGAMLIAVIATLIEMGTVDYRWILLGLAIGSAIGVVVALRVPMTSMPEMVALFNGLGGAGSALVSLAILWREVVEPVRTGTVASLVGAAPAVSSGLSILIGALTLSGSLIAYLKLAGKMPGRPILLPGRHLINLLLVLTAVGATAWFSFLSASPAATELACLALTAVSLILGVMLVIPIGGADMPVVISLLNSYSGLAAAATGFVLGNNVLIISGALVGASGLILTQIMCKAMNRTLAHVLFGGFGSDDSTGGASEDARDYQNVRSCSSEEAALVLEAAESVIIVPGYGLAVAQAQHSARELGLLLENHGMRVTYAIHPVAGRMPGHMNVLLAEADVPYEQLVEMERINSEFKNTDVVLVVGANDVVNPAAERSPGSPIYGMPVLEVWNAQTVLVIKRSLSPGFAGIKNDLFEADNTMMIFEDAKVALQGLISELKETLAA
jgi:NAD(P) transhydrogenase subunit beta